MDGWGISCEIALLWMSLDFTNDKSTLVQVMACAVWQQAITWANVDPDLCRHMALLGHNELKITRVSRKRECMRSLKEKIIQLVAVISVSSTARCCYSITQYYIYNRILQTALHWFRLNINSRVWTHKKSPLSHLHGRANVCLYCEYFRRKLTTL